MATRINRAVIPSSFNRLDSQVSDPDSYINTRDQQVLRENHNVLIARGIKRQLMNIVSANASGHGTWWRMWSIRTPTRDSGDILLFAPLGLSMQTKKLSIVVRAASGSASNDINLVAFLDTPGASGQFATVGGPVTGTAMAKYTVEVPVPRQAQLAGRCTLNLYMEGKMFGSDLLGASCAIDAVGPDYIDVDTTAAATTALVQEGVYVDSDLAIAPRRVTLVQSLPGAWKYRLHIDGPWEQLPIAGTDTIEQREAALLQVESVTIYEQSVTDFGVYQEIP